MKECAIYCRVSTHAQAEDGTSLDTQLAACRAYAERQGYSVVKEMSEDASAGTLDRPGLDAIRDLARTGAINTLVIFKLDRLSRETGDLLALLKEFKRHNVELQSATMPIDATPEGKMLLTMLAAFGEYERAQIVERSRRGKLANARAGQVFVSNLIPYGYDYAEGRLTINPDQAIWLHKMFEWCGNDRLSCYLIAQRLVELQVPTKHSGESIWRKATVRRMLRQSTAKGVWIYRSGTHEVPVPVPAIVSPELWAKAQTRLEEAKHHTRPTIYPYLLSGRVSCALCGHSYTGAGGSGHAYYGCQSRKKDNGLKGKCDNRYWKSATLDLRVWNGVEQLLGDADQIMGLFAQPEDTPNRQARSRAELDTVDRKLADLDKRMGVLLDLVEGGDISRDQFRERKAKLDGERSGLAKLRDELIKQLGAFANAGMSRAEAERLARFWRANREAQGRVFMADADTGENVFEETDFRKWVLDRLSAKVLISGENIYLRGKFDEVLIDANGVLYRQQYGRALPSREPRTCEADS